jgi:acetylglutamate kinase
MQDLIAKAEMLLEALPYIQKFSGATFVIKYGGSFMDSPDAEVRNGVARDIVFLEAVEINPVIVHGGGKAITRAMEKAGLKPSFIQGQRVTDEATAKIADEVLSREINPEVVAAIQSFRGVAKGFAGTDIFKCRKIQMTGADGQSLDLGFVGEVTSVNTRPLQECIREGITPVILEQEEFPRFHIGESLTGEAAQVLRLQPSYTIAGTTRRLIVFKDPKDDQHYIEGLRKAGLPE